MSAIRLERMALSRPVALGELGGGVSGPGAISGLARLGLGGAGDLTFCDRLPGPDLVSLAAGAIVLCTAEIAMSLARRFPEAAMIVTADPRAVLIDLAERLQKEGLIAESDAIQRPFGVHPNARIGEGCVIHPQCRIDEGAVIAPGCVVGPGTWLGARATIGERTVIGANGMNAHRGVDGRQRRFPHLAGTLIGANARIGAGAVVCRGILNSTRVGPDVVIGNLCGIGHVVDVGPGTWIAAGGIIGGHSRVGAGVSIGLGAVIRDNLEIGDGAQIGMGSVVVRDVGAGLSVFGNPARAFPGVKSGPDR